MASPTRRTRSTLPGIDGLRGAAATAIVIYHVWRYSAPDGRPFDLGPISRFALVHLPAGVILFFAISGFLLYRPFAAAVLRGQPLPPWRAYFRNRALRILPAYWAVLVLGCVVLPAGLLQSPKDGVVLGRLTEEPDILIRDAALVYNYFPDSLDTGIGPAWTLAIEVVFYMVLPLLGWLAWRCGRRGRSRAAPARAALVPVAVLLLLGFGIKAVSLAVQGGVQDVLVRSFFYRADLFALGLGLAVLHVQVDDGRVRLPRRWRGAAALVLVTVVLATVVLSDRGALWRWPIVNPYESLQAVAAALLLALVVLPGPPDRRTRPWLVRAFESRVAAAMGLVSYSLFLWHEPLTRWLALHHLTGQGLVGFVGNLAMVGVLSGLAATATYFAVERPALARKAAWSRPPSERGRAPALPPPPTVAVSDGR